MSESKNQHPPVYGAMLLLREILRQVEIDQAVYSRRQKTKLQKSLSQTLNLLEAEFGSGLAALLSKPVGYLSLPGWPANALKANGIKTIGDLVQVDWKIGDLRGIGGYGEECIRETLNHLGLRLKGPLV